MIRRLFLLAVVLICPILSAQTVPEKKSDPKRVIHVTVALCDNENQGIVPVPKSIGNGQDPASNLYWGCQMGVKSFFKRHPDWKFLEKIDKPAAHIFERLVFKHKKQPVYLVADAYDGAYIKETITDFFDYAAGRRTENITVQGVAIGIGGNADLIAYVGHDGLMEFSLDKIPQKADERKREVIILACASQHFFGPPLKATGAYPLLWTTNLMAPEAYSLSAAIDGWLLHETGEQIHERAAQSYNKYQKCGMKGARGLFTTGW